MKRKDFLKSCIALGVIPFIPKMGEGKVIPQVYGYGIQMKNGICYGFWHEENGEIELVMFDYQKIPYISLDKGFHLLHKSLRKRMNGEELSTKGHAKEERKIILSRMKKWAEWFYKRKP